MQGIHEGIGAKLLPTLLAAAPPTPSPPLSLCNCIRPGHKFSSMCPLYRPVLPFSLCFLLFFYLFIFLILPYTETQSQPKVLFFFFSKSKRSHLQLLRRLLDMDVSLCAPHFLYALAAMVFCLFVCFSLCLFYFYFFFLLCVFKCLLKIARLYA